MKEKKQNVVRFKGSHYPKCVVLQAVYWYLRYPLSYRDIEELMDERGIDIEWDEFFQPKTVRTLL